MEEFGPTNTNNKVYAEEYQFSEYGVFGGSGKKKHYLVKQTFADSVKSVTKGLAVAAAGIIIVESSVFASDPQGFIDNVTEMPGSNPSPSSVEELVIATEEHVWDDGVVIKESTCKEEGTLLISCKICDKTKEEKIPLADHTEAEEAATEADCTHAGHTTVIKCSVCGEILDEGEEIPALGHLWGEARTVRNPSCTATGLCEYLCGRCGESRQETIAATGHRPYYTGAVAATCTEAGHTAVTRCSVCGATLDAGSQIAALGHDWMATSDIREATCTEEGAEYLVCSRCGLTQENVVPALGHVDSDSDAKCDRCGVWVVDIVFDHVGAVMEEYTTEAWFRLTVNVPGSFVNVFPTADYEEYLGIEGGTADDEGNILIYLYPDLDAPVDGKYQFSIDLYTGDEEFILSKVFTLDLSSETLIY